MGLEKLTTRIIEELTTYGKAKLSRSAKQAILSKFMPELVKQFETNVKLYHFCKDVLGLSWKRSEMLKFFRAYRDVEFFKRTIARLRRNIKLDEKYLPEARFKMRGNYYYVSKVRFKDQLGRVMEVHVSSYFNEPKSKQELENFWYNRIMTIGFSDETGAGQVIISKIEKIRTIEGYRKGGI